MVMVMMMMMRAWLLKEKKTMLMMMMKKKMMRMMRRRWWKRRRWWWRWWCADDDVLMMVDICTDGVVMMVMGTDDYDKACWQQLFGNNPFQVLPGNGGVCPDGVCPPAGVLVVSQWCFGGRWRLGGGTLGGVSVSLDGARWCFGSCSCFRGVSVVSWRCSGGDLVVSRTLYFLNQNGSPVNTKLASTDINNLAIGVVCWINYHILPPRNSFFLHSSEIICVHQKPEIPRPSIQLLDTIGFSCNNSSSYWPHWLLGSTIPYTSCISEASTNSKPPSCSHQRSMTWAELALCPLTECACATSLETGPGPGCRVLWGVFKNRMSEDLVQSCTKLHPTAGHGLKWLKYV